MNLIFDYQNSQKIFSENCRKLSKREMSLPTGDSKIQTKVSVHPNKTYKIVLSARNVTGNGVIFCNFFGGMRYDFHHYRIVVDSKENKEFVINAVLPDFPSRQSILFRVWRESQDSSGNVILTDIKIYEANKKMSISNNPLVSIVMPVFNQYAVTRRGLKSIAENTDDTPYEIIIVDNGSTDETKQIKKEFKVRIIRNKTNLGFAKACNQGIMAAKGKFVLLLNNDIKIMRKDWLSGMMYSLKYVDITGAAGGVLDLGDFRYKKEVTTNTEDFHYIVGWCMMFKRKLIDKVGLLTEEFGLGLFEDTVFSLVAREKKCKIAITEDVPVFHYGHATVSNLGFIKMYQKNKEKFAAKYGPRLVDLELQRNKTIGKIKSLLPPSVPGKKQKVIPNKVSIITLNYNGIAMLKKVIPSVMKNTVYPFFEWIIVDNGSHDGSVSYIKQCMKKYKNIVLFDRKSNSGNFASINNEAARLADGEFLLFMNNDMEAKKRWMIEMVKILKSDAKVSVVGSKMFYPDKRIQHAGVFFDSRGYPGNFCYLNMKNMNSDVFTSHDREYNAVTGACLMIRHADFLRVGCFHEQYDYCFEDVDLCLSVRNKLKKKVIFAAKSQLTHYESFTTRKSGKKITLPANLKILEKRWKSRLPRDLQTYRKKPKHMIYKKKKIDDQTLLRHIGIDVIVCVDDERQFQQILKPSLKNFKMPVNLIKIDNTKNKYKSMAAAINPHLNKIKYNIFIIAHQDIEFGKNFDVILRGELDKLNRWGVCGVAGVSDDGNPIGKLLGKNGKIWNEEAAIGGPVSVVDECCLILSRDNQLLFDAATFSSFHFYGADICLQAKQKGFDNYVLNLPIAHHSDGGKRSVAKTTKKTYLKEMKKLEKKWIKRYPIINTTTVRLAKNKPPTIFAGG